MAGKDQFTAVKLTSAAKLIGALSGSAFLLIFFPARFAGLSIDAAFTGALSASLAVLALCIFGFIAITLVTWIASIVK